MPASRDLRLLPAAAAGWLGVLIGVRAGPLLGCLLLIACLVTTALALARLWRPPGGRHRQRTHGRAAATVLLAGATAALLVGWSWTRAQARAAAVEPHLRTESEVVLRIDSEPRLLSGDRALLRATWVLPTAGAAADPTWHAVPVTVLADAAWMDVIVGERVRSTVHVAGTDAGDASAALLVAHTEPVVVARAPPLAALVARLRGGLVAASSGLDAQARGLVPGIALGDDRALPLVLAEDLRTVSLTHVTAVSGAHVAMVIGMVLVALRRLPRWWQALLGGLVLLALVLLVHPAASVLRSAAMGGVLLLGLLLGRPRAALPALWSSVVVLLAVDPWLAGSFGFVLSVLATAGLLIASAPLAERLSRYMPRTLGQLLAVPFAAQLACMPALALLQPAMPVHGVLANVLAAPAVPPVTVLGLVAAIVSPLWPPAAQVLAAWAGVATAWVASVAVWCAALPMATVPWWAGVAGGAGVLMMRALMRRR